MTGRRGGAEADGRVLRGESTRARLIDAGVRIFSARDFAAVTTRELAVAADANQAAILYHFGSKEELYRAVAEHVAERARAALNGACAAAAGVRDSRDRASCMETLRTVLRAFTRGLIAMATDGAIVDFIIREQAQPGPGFDILYTGYIGEMHGCITDLVALATGRALDDRSAIVDAHAIIGMALSFAVARTTFHRRARSRRYTSRDVEALADRVADLGCHAISMSAAGSVATSARPRG